MFAGIIFVEIPQQRANPGTEMEYLAIKATWKRPNHLSQSIVVFVVVSFQNTGNPKRCDDEEDVKEEFSARSAMLTWNSQVELKTEKGTIVN